MVPVLCDCRPVTWLWGWETCRVGQKTRPCREAGGSHLRAQEPGTMWSREAAHKSRQSQALKED